MYSAWTLIPVGGVLLVVLCVLQVLIGRRKYRAHQVAGPIHSPFDSPFVWAVQVQPKYWPWWINVSIHETRTDAEYALQVLQTKQYKAISAQPEKVSKVGAATEV